MRSESVVQSFVCLLSIAHAFACLPSARIGCIFILCVCHQRVWSQTRTAFTPSPDTRPSPQTLIMTCFDSKACIFSVYFVAFGLPCYILVSIILCGIASWRKPIPVSDREGLTDNRFYFSCCRNIQEMEDSCCPRPWVRGIFIVFFTGTVIGIIMGIVGVFIVSTDDDY